MLDLFLALYSESRFLNNEQAFVLPNMLRIVDES